MKTKEMDRITTPHFRPARRPANTRSKTGAERLGIKAALLGIICVAGVFGLLGLLYTFG